MNDALLEVYELAMMGDLDGAREMLGDVDAEPEDLEEMRTFLASMEAGGEVEQMSGADAMGGLTGAVPLPSVDAATQEGDGEEE